ncbi:GNAT family N-acetyltransferase [Panacibacter sp. DH6]|uniref:GNAT family N-acetyltransferase n=1 Tax=Panacibacter microcysteis TaxID=2793269 RepID=A0A931GVT9_9BACT|nr:GNAT family N-acetyltransferase [Panacibacter microcysteis]MBG9376795.1 GNAT family N-acetyltransferase [Panacibacter microcysteis]
MNSYFVQATVADIPHIWSILQGAIARRKADGSQQWQDGYPNPEVLQRDIKSGVGYILKIGDEIAGYTAILINDEPAYAGIEGAWLTNDDFVVFHRVAVAQEFLGQGIAKKLLTYIEAYARSKGIRSLKADTNFDNAAMLATFEKMGYQYCGEVWFRGNPRRAYEKVLATIP